MKNNYNPYTVPENFFETAGSQAVTKFRTRRRAVIYGVAAAVVAAAVLVVPMFMQSIDNQSIKTEAVANNLASMYEYDIFLQVNF